MRTLPRSCNTVGFWAGAKPVTVFHLMGKHNYPVISLSFSFESHSSPMDGAGTSGCPGPGSLGIQNAGQYGECKSIPEWVDADKNQIYCQVGIFLWLLLLMGFVAFRQDIYTSVSNSVSSNRWWWWWEWRGRWRLLGKFNYRSTCAHSLDRPSDHPDPQPPLSYPYPIHSTGHEYLSPVVVAKSIRPLSPFDVFQSK